MRYKLKLSYRSRDKFAVHEGSKNFNNGRIAFEMFCLVER